MSPYRWPCAHFGHVYAIVYTRRLRDGFRERSWLRCWGCELKIGPMRSDREPVAKLRGLARG